MEKETPVISSKTKMSLESRLGLMALSTFTTGCTSGGAMSHLLKGEHLEAVTLGAFVIANAVYAFYNGAKAVQDYRK